MSAHKTRITPLAEAFRASLRLVASSVSLVTARDAAGAWHGMAVTSAGSLTLEPPSMMVAINRSASIHPVIAASGKVKLFGRVVLRHGHGRRRQKRRNADGGQFLNDHSCFLPDVLGLAKAPCSHPLPQGR